MCLYPKLIKNRKYVANKKNGGVIPAITDNRTVYVPVGCQKCMECKKKKKNNWSVRLKEEIKSNRSGLFITLTFSNESINELGKDIKSKGYERDNLIATKAVRRFLERYRKENKKSIRHWLITELGHEGTENIHLHGILFCKEEDLKHWKYGKVHIGKYVNDRTINYITKYVTKTDYLHKYYEPKILCSSGIGKNYIKNNKEYMKDYYVDRNGYKSGLPIYYRNNIFNEEQREKLWLKMLDKNERWVGGEKISIKYDDNEYYKALEYYRKKNEQFGYGNDEKDWNKKQYEEDRRNMLYEKRIGKINKFLKAFGLQTIKYPNGYKNRNEFYKKTTNYKYIPPGSFL